MHSIFHPDAVEEHGRVIYCSALNHAALCGSVLATLQALYAHRSASETFSLFVVIPTANEHSLLGMGGKVMAQLKSKYKTNLFLRAPHKQSPFERLLACEGSLAALTDLVPSLLSVFPRPLQYTDPDIHLQLDNVLDLPLNTAAARYKRKEASNRGVEQDAKRSKTTTWDRCRFGPRRTPGSSEAPANALADPRAEDPDVVDHRRHHPRPATGRRG